MLKEKKRENRYSLSLTTNTKQLGEKPPQAAIPKGSTNPLGGFKEEHQAQKPSLEEDSETLWAIFPERKIFLIPESRPASNIYLCVVQKSLSVMKI